MTKMKTWLLVVCVWVLWAALFTALAPPHADDGPPMFLAWPATILTVFLAKRLGAKYGL